MTIVDKNGDKHGETNGRFVGNGGGSGTSKGAQAVTAKAAQSAPPPKIGKTGDRPGDFVTFNGSKDLAEIPNDVVRQQSRGGGLQALPIRLQMGSQRGPHQGFGLRHIAEEHPDLIKASGLTAAQYVYQFFQNVQRIYEEQNRVFFCQTKLRNGNTAMIRLDRQGSFYTVHTLYGKTGNYGKLIWSGRPADLAPSGQGGRHAFGHDTATADSLTESLAKPPSHLPGFPGLPRGASPIGARSTLASQISGVDFTRVVPAAQTQPAIVLDAAAFAVLERRIFARLAEQRKRQAAQPQKVAVVPTPAPAARRGTFVDRYLRGL